MQAGAWLFWDPALGQPPAGRIPALLSSPGQVWHAGLRLGAKGEPRSLDFVSPTWMLNADAPPDRESTSWRFSLRAGLIRSEALRHCGGPRPEFDGLEAAGLDMGLRFVKAGVIVRYTPQLLEGAGMHAPCRLTLADQLRLLCGFAGRFWTGYAAARMILSGFANPFAAAAAARLALQEPEAPRVPPYPHAMAVPRDFAAKVTVLIPTVDRYPYLRRVLAQLEKQTVRPAQIVIVDQTAVERRDLTIAQAVEGIPVRLLHLERPGQCSARNAGLAVAEGDHVLFIDDDDEVEPDLIERHLACLAAFRADVSAGVAQEVDSGPLPAGFTFTRASDVFPTNNCMIRKEVLERSGLFDLAYDRGARADGDLGMRIHLSGALMILNPAISVLHHHAPQGGLRTHKARKITYAASRRSLIHRHLPSPTECYLWKRYFTARQIREEAWLRALGTLAVRGGVARKLAKALVGIACMPHTWWSIRRSLNAADRMLRTHPTIPALPAREASQVLA